MSMMSSGNEGCSCINTTSVLASLENQDCKTANGLPGVYLTLGGSCVTYDFGSNTCLQHDLIQDPICQGDPSNSVVPPYCMQTWCYVDAKSCKKNSEEDVFKSDYFPQLDIFYSYTTCNSTDYFWQQHVGSSVANASVAGGVNISAAVPGLYNPVLLKELPDGTLIWNKIDDGDAYYFDDSIPYGGIYIDYVNSLVKISNGDIQNVTYTHTSRASLKRYPASRFTAAVRDVENGLVDMAVGPFWITGQRLRMTTFTVPLTYDETVLVIPKPGTKSSLGYQTQKVLYPFTNGLWLVVLAVIVVASLLSVWFTDREMAAKKRYGLQLKQSNRPRKRRKYAYFRLILDAFLEKGLFFFSAGIEQDMGASLPHKVLMFGFGFFILIAVSAYVAELAAMLTQSGLEKSVGTMQQVVDRNIPICGHPALEEEMRIKWPKANWFFDNPQYADMLEAYDRGDCKVLAIGKEDSTMDVNFMNKLCELDLVYTESLVIENPIAFPINPQLASAFSYWMYTAEKTYGIDLNSVKKAFIEKNDIKPQCEIQLSQLSNNSEELPQVSPSNMFLPIMFFVGCALIAAAMEMYHESKRRKGRTTTFGRKSTLDIYLNSVVKQPVAQDKIDVGAEEDGDARRKEVRDFPGANIPGDDFHENGAPQSSSAPKSTFRGLNEDADKTNNLTADSVVAVKGEDNDISHRHRIEELVESGVIDDVLDCFDFFQEMKKLKKDQ